MKKTFSIIRNILAIIGGLTIIVVIVMWITSPYYDIVFNETNLARFGERVELLQESGDYDTDTNVFTMKIIQDSARAKEIRDYFQLDTLFPEDANTWEKTIAIGKFVASNIPHDNQRYGQNISMPLDCGNTQRMLLLRLTVGCIAF